MADENHFVYAAGCHISLHLTSLGREAVNVVSCVPFMIVHSVHHSFHIQAINVEVVGYKTVPSHVWLLLTISVDYSLLECQTTIRCWNKFLHPILVIGRFGSADREFSAWLECGRASARGPNRIPID